MSEISMFPIKGSILLRSPGTPMACSHDPVILDEIRELLCQRYPGIAFTIISARGYSTAVEKEEDKPKNNEEDKPKGLFKKRKKVKK